MFSRNPLATPGLLVFDVAVGERAWVSCRDCSAIANTLVCYQQFLAKNTEHGTVRIAMRKDSSTPARSHTQAKLNSDHKALERLVGRDL